MDYVPARQLVDVHGATVRLPDPDRLVHMQFRRFAGCPVCNLHLRSFVARHAEVQAAGVHEVVLFHTNTAALLPHVADLPFDVVADPAKDLYREFGVESSPRSLLHPKAWPWIVRAIAAGLPDVLHERRPTPPRKPEGGRLGLPADFLIAPDGRVLASHHGTHVYDQWSVDDLLNLSPVRRG
ncbi:peroxiredoxin-like family protein [Actinophytocola sp.]|uniref:peroxiredoxin-like family protein n=1 Tax=Actinophytocola sp. TaxID=1872138 RepID=UPI002D2C1E1C|nr:peroxiredoxin-like family protein [Actinophytocola sp.]HYQ62407.1 peroxiredoxin-like family protein [Actinophytocola sp.]